MDNTHTFALVAEERRALADVLDQLTASQLRTPSLCPGWTVHDVAAHVVMILEISTGEAMRAVLVARGNFDKANVALTRRWAKRPSHQITAGLRRNAESRFTPPGQGPEASLADLMVHELDIARPLGISRALPEEPLRLVLDFLMALRQPPGPGPTLVPKGLLHGLRLVATDMDWEYGAGARASGPAEDLLLAITGRPHGTDRLTGNGAELLRRRLR